ncbi:uncharacterized protein LOC118271605 [Spodoptera frugiperda]|uniref:Uncharacterized protein LOC118271605 n=1 Tax=Spodoptera frugiperda TaxID=7108 RepID=A0A9R0EM98_SPOFR|nr:uncharacterized protein LOC118271605 [Spodoptera frugiperda]
MVYFVSGFRVFVLLCALPITLNNAEKISAKDLPNAHIISAFLKQFIKPYMETIHDDENKAKLRAERESKVEKAIQLKMTKLKPLLDDLECNALRQDKKIETENDLTLNGNKETTIIEFVSKRRSNNRSTIKENKQALDPFQKNIKRYKALRHKIKQALLKENAASSTKRLIMRTLDEMLAMLIEGQCTWKSVDTTALKKHMFNHPTDMRKSMKHLQKLSNEEWMSLRRQYVDYLRSSTSQENAFIQQFHEFFSSVLNNTWDLTKYTVQCQLVKLKQQTTNKPDNDSLVLRNKIRAKDTNHCDSFSVCVCTDELKYFFTDFHSHLNDTAVGVFKDYGAMYVKDTSADTEIDKDIVQSALDTLSKTAGKKICKIYRKQLQDFKLDEKNGKSANIDNINNFIKSTKDEVKTALLKIVDYELSAMTTKLFKTVKDDLVVNLKTDLDNMETRYSERVCALFASCNGVNIASPPVASRRVDEKHWVYKPKDDNVYVKVQLSLDDELKDSIASFRRKRLLDGKDLTRRLNRDIDLPVRIEEFKEGNLSVTRTTLLEMTSAKILVPNLQTTKTTSFKLTRTVTPENTLITHHTTKRSRKKHINVVYKK